MSSFTPLVLPCPVRSSQHQLRASSLPPGLAGGGTHWEVREEGKERPLEDTALEAVGPVLRERDQVALGMQWGGPKLLPHTRHTAEAEGAGSRASEGCGQGSVGSGWSLACVEAELDGRQRCQVISAGKDVAGWCPTGGG